MIDINYKNYRWFFTSSEKLVVGGKSAIQNDELLNLICKDKNSYVVMHTHQPGSPFAVIISPASEVNEEDKDECGVFTASFSRAWRSGDKETVIDSFLSKQLYKSPSMKLGTWGVKPPIAHFKKELNLVLAEQKGILRAVPPNSSKINFGTIFPGSLEKEKAADNIIKLLKRKISKEEVLSALPSRRINFRKNE